MSIKENITKIILKENSNIILNTEEDYDSTFRDIGVDSLDLMMAMLKIGEQYTIDISENDFDEITTVNELVQFIKHATKQTIS